MLSLLNVHYHINKNIFFDESVSDDSFMIYNSRKIEDIFWNFAVLSEITTFKKVADDIYAKFEELKRKPCIYINSLEAETLKELIERKFMVKYTESWLRYGGEGLQNIHPVREIKTEEDFNEFKKLFSDIYGNILPQRSIYTPAYISCLQKTFEADHFYHFLCYENNQAVAGASLGFYNGYCMVYNLVTHPDFIDKGYTQSVLHACTQKCKEICGKEIYALVDADSATEKRMVKHGFKKVFTGYGLIKQL